VININLSSYKTLVFDCDGVLLNSNQIKTKAFHKVALRYGKPPADKLVAYHVQHGGVSRYKKFEYLITDILEKPIEQDELSELLACFAKEVYNGLMNCDIAEGLDLLREKTGSARWLVVSGGDQQELRKVFSCRGIDVLFDGGIFGSPDTKELILKREEDCGNIVKQGLFLGDSQYDYQAAMQADLDFIFISSWSEWASPKSGLQSVSKLKDLV